MKIINTKTIFLSEDDHKKIGEALKVLHSISTAADMLEPYEILNDKGDSVKAHQVNCAFDVLTTVYDANMLIVTEGSN